uniref:Uncharacterized protein n=1 Tax=Anopheles culicifacies TaxID=139723 RepID=A0A182MWK2_9DIPT
MAEEIEAPVFKRIGLKFESHSGRSDCPAAGVTLEEQMICGALQTLNEDAFEDVVSSSERPSPTGEMFSQYLAPIRESSEIGSPPRLTYNLTNPNLTDLATSNGTLNGDDSGVGGGHLGPSSRSGSGRHSRSHSLHDDASLTSIVVIPTFLTTSPSTTTTSTTTGNINDTKL